MLTLHTGTRWRSPTTYICTEHRQRHFRANMKETYLIKFLWDWCALQFTPTWKWNYFFCWSSKRERSLLLGHSGGHHPWEDRCQKDSASYTVTNCGDLGTPEPLCHCFFKKGGGFSKQKTLTTDDFVVVVVVLTLLGKLGYFSESRVTWAWSLTPVSPELGKLGHKAYCECKG